MSLPRVSIVNSNHARPVECVMEMVQSLEEENECPRFRVIRSRGKTLGSGGYGYYRCGETSSSSVVAAAAAETSSSSPSRSESYYLFLEEVLYLYERGLLEVTNITAPAVAHQLYSGLWRSSSSSSSSVPRPHHLTSGCSQAAYLVYQHLRSQTFRVVRHTPHRQRIVNDMMKRIDSLLQQDEQHTNAPNDTVENRNDTVENRNDNDDDSHIHSHTLRPQKRRRRRRPLWRSDARLQAWKVELRRDAAQALPPAVYPPLPPSSLATATATTATATTMRPQPAVAWECYNPESTFASACPGLPDFQVVIAYFNMNSDQCGHVPWVTQQSTRHGMKEKGTCQQHSEGDGHAATANVGTDFVDDDAAAIVPPPPSPPLSGLLFSDLVQLLQSSSSSSSSSSLWSVPLKIATVSDSGTVVMFGVTDFGVPSIVEEQSDVTNATGPTEDT